MKTLPHSFLVLIILGSVISTVKSADALSLVVIQDSKRSHIYSAGLVNSGNVDVSIVAHSEISTPRRPYSGVDTFSSQTFHIVPFFSGESTLQSEKIERFGFTGDIAKWAYRRPEVTINLKGGGNMRLFHREMFREPIRSLSLTCLLVSNGTIAPRTFTWHSPDAEQGAAANP